METNPFVYNRALLENAFKRYESGVRATHLGSEILAERAEVELKYARALKEWAVKSRLIVDSKDFDPSTEIRQLYLGACAQAESLSQLHHDAFNAFRNRNSPFEKITSIEQSRKARTGREIDVGKLTADFKKAKATRRSLQDCESQWMRVRDRYIQKLKRLAETDLSGDDSRETKRQSLDAQITDLQAKIDNANKRVASSGAKLKAFEEKQTEVFKATFKDLQVVERHRLEATVEAFKRFHEITYKTERMEWRSCLADRIAYLKTLVASVCVDKIISRWEEDTDTKLKSSISRQSKSLMSILFDTHPALRRQGQNFGSDIGRRPGSSQFIAGNSLRYCESLACRREPIRIRPGKRQQPAPESQGKDQSLMGAFYSSGSSCESLTPVPQNRTAKAHVVTVIPATEILESTSIGSFDNPEKMIAVPATLAPNIAPTCLLEFCAPSQELSQEVFQVLSTSPARLSLTTGIVSPIDLANDATDVEPGAEEEDAGSLVNSKVRAICDYFTQEQGHLTFSKGQVIKQKVARDEHGHCFGWTKNGRFAPKRYGFYPAEYVSFYQK